MTSTGKTHGYAVGRVTAPCCAAQSAHDRAPASLSPRPAANSAKSPRPAANSATALSIPALAVRSSSSSPRPNTSTSKLLTPAAAGRPSASPQTTPKHTPTSSPRPKSGPKSDVAQSLSPRPATASSQRATATAASVSKHVARSGSKQSPAPPTSSPAAHRGAKEELQSLQHAFMSNVSAQAGDDQDAKHTQAAELAVPRSRKKRFSRGASLTPFVPGGDDRSPAHKKEAQLEDEAALSPSGCPLPSGIQPYLPFEVPYLGSVPLRVSAGSRLRLIAFDFDQTLAATHLFFRLKNQQSRARALKAQEGKHGPSLVKLLLDGTVPLDEIWGGQARLNELKAHLEELSALGVFMVVITKGAGRVVDIALQLAGLRDYFQAVLDPQTSMGAKLMTVQVLMNTAFDERLRPVEAVLVDDDLKNLVMDVSAEEVSSLPPVFQGVERVQSVNDDWVGSGRFQDGHLMGPFTVCQVMRADNGVKAWQLQELVRAAAPESCF